MDYFGKETDDAIKQFLEASSDEEKHRIFNISIRPAFEKLIQNLIYVYRFYSIDDVETLKRDCLANLYEMLPRFDANKGSKGFSYFNVVAKNWFIMRTRERNKKNRLESDLYYDLDHEFVKNDPSFTVSPYEDVIQDREFWLALFDNMDEWRERLQTKQEKQLLDAIVFLLKNPDLVTIYSRKAAYLYLREITGLSSKQVAMNLKKIKSLYDLWKTEYDAGDDDG